jgi:hypothetical protein
VLRLVALRPRPRNVQHSSFQVYHVPSQCVLDSLSNASVDRQIQLGYMSGVVVLQNGSEPFFLGLEMLQKLNFVGISLRGADELILAKQIASENWQTPTGI